VVGLDGSLGVVQEGELETRGGIGRDGKSGESARVKE
jgi:hypothetical protein